MVTSGRYDAIVLGVGGMGSASLYQLARRGKRVLGLEQFGVPHDLGSSHGLTRIIRMAYYEHPSYVPLLRRSYELWRELERGASEKLLFITGGLDVGRPGDRIFEGSLLSVREHGLRHDVLTAAEVRKRVPGFQLPEGFRAVFQPDAGFLIPEACVAEHARAAAELGATLHTNEAVVEWQPLADGVRVTTGRGTYEGERLVITAGPWAATVLPRLAGLAVPERQVLGWFDPLKPELFSADRFPIFNLMDEVGHYYGFPTHVGEGFKIGKYHHLEQQVSPNDIDRAIHSEDEAPLRDCVARYFPDANGPATAFATCMFTNSPDENFIVDVLPDLPQVSVAAGFSGHGFKFCSVIGEIMADLAERGATDHDIGLFRLERFTATQTA